MIPPKTWRRFVWALLSAMLAAGVHVSTASAQTRLVAVGDVHGACSAFDSILKETGLVDAKRGASGGWKGQAATLIQLGDIVDGGGTRECLDMVMSLEKSAVKTGKVVPLLGNHEIMAMTGDFGAVTADDYAGFATKQSEKIRQEAFLEYRNYLAARFHAGFRAAKPLDEKEWMADHPLGYFERRDAFGPDGVYGRWLRKHDVAYESDGVLFVHGGLSPNASFDNIDDLNRQVRGELAAFDRNWRSLWADGIIWRYMELDEAVVELQRERAALPLREEENTKRKEQLDKFIELLTWLSSPDTPFSYRGLAIQPDQVLEAPLQALLTKLRVKAIVAGHIVMPDFEIHQRLGGRVFLIDTGMRITDAGGKATALEIENGRFTAHSVGRPPRVLTGAPRP